MRKFKLRSPRLIGRKFPNQELGDVARQKTATAGKVNFDDPKDLQLAFEKGEEFEKSVFVGEHNGDVSVENKAQRDRHAELKNRKVALYEDWNETQKKFKSMIFSYLETLKKLGVDRVKKKHAAEKTSEFVENLIEIRKELNQETVAEKKQELQQKFAVLHEQSGLTAFPKNEDLEKLEKILQEMEAAKTERFQYFKEKIETAKTEISDLCADVLSDQPQPELDALKKNIWNAVSSVLETDSFTKKDSSA
ncbi:hypothetical protein HN954_04350 [bacterium]|jgi:hypothetical protein|nr:hypothetical protein [bacterium]MBT6831935.1 hypothetical protein [bacterium]MBT6996631.1 hypothetical protein [bacterium]MBT7773051.1 hypothetical protein [bacterium]